MKVLIISDLANVLFISGIIGSFDFCRLRVFSYLLKSLNLGVQVANTVDNVIGKMLTHFYTVSRYRFMKISPTS